MPEPSSVPQISFEIVLPDGTCQLMRVTQSPFYIGRGGDGGNHLQLADRRISRQCAVVLLDGGSYRLQDRGQRTGLFINGERISAWILRDGDVVTFGLENSCHLVFHFRAPAVSTASIESLLTRIGSVSTEREDPGGLAKLNLLLEATRLLHSQLPLGLFSTPCWIMRYPSPMPTAGCYSNQSPEDRSAYVADGARAEPH
jgi:hypothetical protein